MKLPELPAGWHWTKVSEVGEVQLGRQRSPEHHRGENMRPYLRVANVFEDRIDTSDVLEMNFTPEEYERYKLVPGDVLLNEGQSRELVGRPAIYRGEVPGACFQNTLVRFRSGPAVIPQFALAVFRHYLRSGRFQAISKWTTSIAHLGAERFALLEFPLPPLDEQRRIVAKIEALLARSRRAKQALDAIPVLLERFRQSVLAAAFRGDLTRSWRDANPDVGSASKLVERIRVERRRRWEEAELKRMQSKGKLPKDDRWKEKYEEAPPADTSGPGKLPDGWCWASLEQLTINFDGERVPVKRQDRAERTGTFPYYGASGVIDQVDDYLFDGHFLLIAEDGANLLSRSTPIAFEAIGKFWVNNHAHVIQVPGELVPLTYLGSYLNGFDLSPFVTGTAQPKLTQKNMNRIPVPLAPQAEQEAITTILRNVRRSELLIDDALARARTRSEVLEAAILGSAFRGELVPQDPNDEPASVLLERIRAECERPEKVDSTSHSRRRRETKVA